tara:strand:+ start:2404 stop:2862 length:459 start_codon:yes stop_codon:yes gene_type:complete
MLGACQVDEVDSYNWGGRLGNSVQIGVDIISVDIADTPELRMIGLSEHERLDEGSGMLFVYSKAGSRAFWMKGMEFPLDIIWITSDCRIGKVTENVQVPNYENVNDTGYRTYESDGPVQFVLEVNSGYADEHNVRAGDAVVFLGPLTEDYQC